MTSSGSSNHRPRSSFFSSGKREKSLVRRQLPRLTLQQNECVHCQIEDGSFPIIVRRFSLIALRIFVQEERKRTGRMVAAGTAIFIFLLGVYQALAGEKPQYAALFLPALIMFTYVGWILYASKHQHRFLIPISHIENEQLREVVSDSQSIRKSSINLLHVHNEPPEKKEKKQFEPRPHKTFLRTYSIA